MTTVTLPVPDSMTQEQAKLLYAIKLFEEGEISSGKAAEIAGLGRPEFWEGLRRRGIPAFEVTEETLREDLETLRKLTDR